MKLELGKVKVGDGITGHMYSDAHAFTVIRVSPSGKTFWAQRDKAKLKKNWKPEIAPGGFVGHCTNQDSQDYDYEPDPNGSIIQCRWSQKKQCFQCLNRYRGISGGRWEFYDYNF
jgi:hypothetical protein